VEYAREALARCVQVSYDGIPQERSARRTPFARPRDELVRYGPAIPYMAFRLAIPYVASGDTQRARAITLR
jgi:hypothetical protein